MSAKQVKSKKPASHPPYATMVASALKAGDQRKGCSLIAVNKYIQANYTVPENHNKILRQCVRRELTKGTIVNKTGNGCSGSFKLAVKVVKAKKPAAKKKVAAKSPSKAKPKKSSSNAAAAKAKKAAKPKKVSAKKVTKSPAKKKPAAKKPAKSPAKKKPAAKKPVAKKAPKKK